MKSNVKAKLNIIAVSFLCGVSALAVPALSVISGIYPDVPDTQIMMINTLHTFFAIPGSLFCSAMCNKLGKKIVSIVSVLMIGIGGVLPAFFGSFTTILVGRAILGLGYGTIMVMPLIYINSFLPPEERPRYFGLNTAMITAAYFVLPMIGGYLGQIGNIKALWLGHLVLALVIVIPVIFMFPKTTAQEELVNSETQAKRSIMKEFKSLPLAFYLIIISNSIVNSACGAYLTELSFFIEEAGFGSAAFAGTVMSISSIISFFASIILSTYFKLWKKWAIVVLYVLSGAGMILSAQASSTVMLFIGIFLYSLQSAGNAAVFVYIGCFVKGTANETATSIFQTVGLGSNVFLVYLPMGIASLLHMTTYASHMAVAGGIYIAGALFFVLFFMNKKYRETVEIGIEEVNSAKG